MPAPAQSSTDLELAGLARNAEARQAAYESQLASLDSNSAEHARIADLRDRNARVLEGYRQRLGSSASGPAAPSSGAPAAPESSGGMFSGITSKISGLFGGGSSGNPSGPEAQSWGGAGGAAGGFSIGTYLKENWGQLAGGIAGSIAGGMIASRLAGGNKLAYIAGSLVGGWVGGKIGGFVQNKFFKKGGSSSGGDYAQTAPQQQQGPSGYTQTAGGTVYNAPGVQITYPQGYGAATIPPAPQASSLAEARELMNGRYQAFLASQSNPALQAQYYQQYMQQKSVYEQWVQQARAQAGATR